MESDPSKAARHGTEDDGDATPTTHYSEHGLEQAQKMRLIAKLESQSNEFNGLAESKPTVELSVNADATTLQKLQDIFKGHNAVHGERMEQLKQELREEFRSQFQDKIKDKIREAVRGSLISQVQVQIDQQLQEYIPVALKQQAEDLKGQIREVKTALQNSESRMSNALLQVTDLYAPLAVILTPEGEKSKLYPADICSLLAYDLDTAKALIRDYGLVDSDDLEVNFRTFLVHIGVNVASNPSMNVTNPDS
ncbi:hypothetical protein D9611_000305 [Ephemerocybe angulata]|uniref:Uncharacterized protein n=1 Tax=Ephemerocybe angulata TaxID=980116 RepID=A0A8H5F731_9AGAR|nr:hypothetical protein D9611_000305 [Tulosesus angulatus]